VDPTIYPAFAVPFAEALLPNPERLTAELAALLLAREARGDEYRNPNASLKQHSGVFESEFNLFSSPERCIAELKAFCWTALGKTVAQLNGYPSAQMQKLQIHSHSWFHITRHGGFTITHTHPMASWSGVFCVTPGETPVDRPESGVLRFHNPHFWSSTFMDPGNAHQPPPYHHGFWNLKLKPGMLVLFPSWVPHEVMTYFGRDERITVAFNCWFSMRE